MKAALTTPFVNSFAVTCHITTYSNSRCYHFIKTNCNCILSIHNTRINKNVPRLNGHTCGSSPFVSDTSQRDLLAPPVSWQSWLVFLSMDTHPSTNPAQWRLTHWHDMIDTIAWNQTIGYIMINKKIYLYYLGGCWNANCSIAVTICANW